MARDLNTSHYEGVDVFASEGLKVTFDRNKVPPGSMTKGEDGAVVATNMNRPGNNKVAPEAAPTVQVMLLIQ